MIFLYQKIYNNNITLEGHKRMNSRGDLLKCQEPTCDQTVRIYNPWCGLWVKFRCAKCLKHLNFNK